MQGWTVAFQGRGHLGVQRPGGVIQTLEQHQEIRGWLLLRLWAEYRGGAADEQVAPTVGAQDKVTRGSHIWLLPGLQGPWCSGCCWGIFSACSVEAGPDSCQQETGVGREEAERRERRKGVGNSRSLTALEVRWEVRY